MPKGGLKVLRMGSSIGDALTKLEDQRITLVDAKKINAAFSLGYEEWRSGAKQWNAEKAGHLSFLRVALKKLQKQRALMRAACAPASSTAAGSMRKGPLAEKLSGIPVLAQLPPQLHNMVLRGFGAGGNACMHGAVQMRGCISGVGPKSPKPRSLWLPPPPAYSFDVPGRAASHLLARCAAGRPHASAVGMSQKHIRPRQHMCLWGKGPPKAARQPNGDARLTEGRCKCAPNCVNVCDPCVHGCKSARWL